MFIRGRDGRGGGGEEEEEEEDEQGVPEAITVAPSGNMVKDSTGTPWLILHTREPERTSQTCIVWSYPPVTIIFELAGLNIPVFT